MACRLAHQVQHEAEPLVLSCNLQTYVPFAAEWACLLDAVFCYQTSSQNEASFGGCRERATPAAFSLLCDWQPSVPVFNLVCAYSLESHARSGRC